MRTPTPLRRRLTIRSAALYRSEHGALQRGIIVGVELHNGAYRYRMCDADGPISARVTAADVTTDPPHTHTPWRARISAIYHAAADRDLPWNELHPRLPDLYFHLYRNNRARAMTTLRALERQVGIHPTRRRTARHHLKPQPHRAARPAQAWD
ncbi:hypothetical protein GCM10009827_115220 [Dactylosporangium maewongense]|uniref:Transposase n=1 Tax=Dactylosporangium maewongense TaxID=634393 RepID=A0ABN2DBI2_9ACTN